MGAALLYVCVIVSLQGVGVTGARLPGGNVTQNKFSIFYLLDIDHTLKKGTLIANVILALGQFLLQFFLCDWRECYSHFRVLLVIYHYTFMLDSYIHNFHRSVFNHILTRSNVQTFLKKYR